MALALRMASPELRSAAVSTVAGNAPIDTVTGNAERSSWPPRLTAARSFQGAARPLVVEPRHATDIWGGDGRLPLAAAH